MTSVYMAPDGMHVVSASYDNTVRIGCLEMGLWCAPAGHTAWVLSVCMAPDGMHVCRVGRVAYGS